MKYWLFLSVFCFSFVGPSQRTPEEIVQENLDFYNKGDIEGFMTSFSDDIALFEFGKATPSYQGLDAIRKVYTRLFNSSPELYSTILHRAVMGNKVIDHESITGRNGKTEPLELVLIYEVNNQKISKMTVIRK